MNYRMLNINMFKRSNAIDVLLILLRRGDLSFGELVMEIQGSTTLISHTVRDLQRTGLLQKRQEKKSDNSLVSLTEKGEKVGKLLVEIEKELSKGK